MRDHPRVALPVLLKVRLQFVKLLRRSKDAADDVLGVVAERIVFNQLVVGVALKLGLNRWLRGLKSTAATGTLITG